MREITYSQNGEYQIPDISLEETRGTIGKYGLMRKEYLRNHKVARFNILTLQNRLDSHLMEIDSQARRTSGRSRKRRLHCTIRSSKSSFLFSFRHFSYAS